MSRGLVGRLGGGGVYSVKKERRELHVFTDLYITILSLAQLSFGRIECW